MRGFVRAFLKVRGCVWETCIGEGVSVEFHLILTCIIRMGCFFVEAERAKID